MKKHILIGTSVFQKYKRQDLSIDGLKHLAKNFHNVDCCLIQQLADRVEYTDIQCYRELTRNSMSVAHTSKNIPFVNDIFNILAAKSKDIFVFCNSDIIVTPKLIEYINSIDVEAFGISRTDIADMDSIYQPARLVRNEPAGFDCWVISKTWWTKHKDKFEDFLLGRPFFDVMYTMIMLLNSNNSYVSDRELIYHIRHQQVSFQEDVCFMFNKNQKIKHYEYLEEVWSKCTESTYARRYDFGTFFNYLPNEQGIIQEIKSNYIQQILNKQRKNVLFDEEFANVYMPIKR